MSVAVLNKEERVKKWVQDILMGFLASVVIALFAPISVKLPFFPVPFTVQNNVVLFLAAIMGSRRGALSVAFYLCQGIAGYPVFAAGKSGLAHLLGPTGGYLIGYLVAAFIVGKLIERSHQKSPLYHFQMMGIGCLIIYFLGASYLSHFIGLKGAIIYGVLPFVITDTIKLIFFSRLLFRYR